ncbi:MAG: phytoene/squalene synthase family protein [Acidobacteriota bacterium]|nr:phytoene/squalene synthase family protein [Acidobacteriota bacterium]
MIGLDQSYAYCRTIARTRARNFYYSFLLLEREQKNAMCAMYAFMRFCDDLSDEQGASLSAIAQWQAEMDAALKGQYGQHPLWPAFDDSVRRFRIPHQYFYDIIAGVSSDLETRHIETFDELYRYCYLVASVVGLTTIHIFGFDSPEALPLAEKCGIAFQLTNILRDVREDAQNDRVYIPAEDLRRFDTDLRTHNSNFVGLMEFETARARDYYEQSRPLLDVIHQRSRPSLWALIQIYRRLLDRIERSNFDVLERRISLPLWEKLSIVARAAVM